MIITGILCGTLLLLVLAILLLTPGENQRKSPCYFADTKVQHDGRTIGAGACSGKVEFVFHVQPEHPARGLNGVKCCPAHVGAMTELSALLAENPTGYWVVAD